MKSLNESTDVNKMAQDVVKKYSKILHKENGLNQVSVQCRAVESTMGCGTVRVHDGGMPPLVRPARETLVAGDRFQEDRFHGEETLFSDRFFASVPVSQLWASDAHEYLI